MTAEKEGIFIFDDETSHVGALVVDGEIDPVGAGDSCTAGIVSALCAGATLEEAALLGNITASITVRKIGQTGTASPEEVIARFSEHIGTVA
jgi:sugar/nucleoside kinase (ribokinase family)